MDELLRDFRSGPIPGPEAARHTARLARERAGRGRWRDRAVRRVGLVAVGLAVSGLVTVLGVLLVLSPSRSSTSSTPRADYGVMVSVEVVPDAGATVKEATDRAIAAIEARGRSRDVAGLSVERIADGELRLTLPAGKEWGPNVPTFLDFAGVDVFDIPAVQVARVTTSGDLRAVLSANAAPDGSVAGYTLLSQKDGPVAGLPDFHLDRASAERTREILRSSGPSHPLDVVPIPAGLRLLAADEQGTATLVVRDAPVIRSVDIAAVRADGQRLVLDIKSASLERVRVGLQAAEVRALHDHTSGELIAVDRRYGANIIGTLQLASTDAQHSDALVVQPGRNATATQLVDQLGDQPIGAQLRIADTQPYGTVPLSAGEPPASLPAWIEQARLHQPDHRTTKNVTVEIPRETIRRVLTTQNDTGTWALYTGRTPYATDALWLDRNGRASGGGGECDPAIGLPPLSSCGGFGVSGLGGPGYAGYFGRTGDAVTAIEVRTSDGQTHAATVANGWWFIAIQTPNSGSAGDLQPPLTEPRPTWFIARNAEGRELARLDIDGKLVLPGP